MKKIAILSLALFVGLSGVAYAATKWNGFDIKKVYFSGKEVKSTVPSIVVKGQTFVPLSMLKQFGLSYTADTKGIKVTAPPPKTVTKIVEKVVEAPRKSLSADDIQLLSNRTVALIYATDDQGKVISQGSGFVVTSRGKLATAYHVAEENGVLYNLKVILNGKTYLIAKDKYTFADKEKDVYITQLPEGLYDYIPFNPGEMKEHDVVYALGYPKAISTVVKGEISYTYQGFVLYKMFADHGTSGGAVINQFGEVVGVIQTGGDTVDPVGHATGGTYLQDLIK